MSPETLKTSMQAMAFVACGTIAAGTLPTAAFARVALSDDAHITRSLVSAAVGAAIADQCSSIERRNVTVFFKTMALKRYAQDLGYSSKEINAFVKNKAEQKRIRDLAFAYLTSKGLTVNDTDAFCTLGRQEIANKTLTGQMLRENR